MLQNESVNDWLKLVKTNSTNIMQTLAEKRLTRTTITCLRTRKSVSDGCTSSIMKKKEMFQGRRGKPDYQDPGCPA